MRKPPVSAFAGRDTVDPNAPIVTVLMASMVKSATKSVSVMEQTLFTVTHGMEHVNVSPVSRAPAISNAHHRTLEKTARRSAIAVMEYVITLQVIFI